MKNQKTIRVGVALLLAAVLLCLAACTGSSSVEGISTAQQEEERTVPATVETGVVRHGWISATEFLQNDTVRDWYEEAKERESLTNSLLYAQESDGTWHCWLYIGAWREGDLLRIGCEATDQNHVVLRYIPQYVDTVLGSTGAHYFTLTGVESPDFSLYLNSDTEGFLSVHSNTSVKR